MPFPIRPRFGWRLRSRTIALGSRTIVMGILNVTPDSFSDGGRFFDAKAAVERGLAMLDEGADILDVGGESTRPNATALSAEEEQERVLPVIRELARVRPDAILSIDTYHASTARLAAEARAEIVNDVSGHLWDEAMPATCAGLGCGVVLMHTRGRPKEWAALPPLAPAEVLPLVCGELLERVAAAVAGGVEGSRVVLDPGFGFGKLAEANYALLAGFGELRRLGYPVLAGLSRKGFLAAPRLDGVPEDRLPGTLAANTAAVLAGAHVLRVHDVRAAVRAAGVADAILAAAVATS